ncbi:hypothetical protein DFH09DRAFT_1145159 [Mycena vulgaris]|nr:hypothetical protein DFH09DRAFT_1145159 [Mycena vulgaris]
MHILPPKIPPSFCHNLQASTMFQIPLVSVAVVVALFGSTQACLRIQGTAQQNAFSQDVSFGVYENGVAVCGFTGGGKGNAKCDNGYTLHFDYDDNPTAGPIPMTYHNPVTGPWELRVPMSCFFTTGCCPSAAPCTCADCQFNATWWCGDDQ